MTTPARQQYLDIKAQHQDAILLYQVGDFFETFDEDARIAARELQIVLTRRAYGPDDIAPLAGVPLHAMDGYAAKLIAKGYRVAICEQVSAPGKGLVRREVTRVLTPGTVTDPSMVPASRDNYLVAVTASRKPRRGGDSSLGLAYVDVSTGAFACAEWAGEEASEALADEIERLGPAEVLVADENETAQDGSVHAVPELVRSLDIQPTPCPARYFDQEDAQRRICRHFGVATLAAFGCDDAPAAAASAGALLAYVQRMNPALLFSLDGLRRYNTDAFVHVDGKTWRALEIVERFRGPRQRQPEHRAPTTLLETLDCTLTAMGARRLRRTLLHPLRDRYEVERRLGAVERLAVDEALREGMVRVLRGMGDLERLTARLVQRLASPREVLALSAALARVADAKRVLGSAPAEGLADIVAQLDPCDDVRQRIDGAILDPLESGGRRLRDGSSRDLDELVQSTAATRAWIAALEPRERDRTGIKSLKVGYNKVFGYYLEVSHANTSRVPPDYQRKQTLANAERYVTEELQLHEALVLDAEERIATLEQELYEALLEELAAQGKRLAATAGALAQLDVWLALATTAANFGYVRPELSDGTELAIRGGRHPVVERQGEVQHFTPNDTHFDACEGDERGIRVALLTGPNMAGKSTYLRQTALIVLLAQVGSFVPAEFARVGMVDRIFTRVGAEDDLAAGLSTFMVEMVETAYILRHASERSLIALDEVGRGTSTRDGLAIARAVLEHIHSTIGARTLFATHFHELATLATSLPGIRVLQMQVAERENEVIFLHRVIAGACDESYGVHVARMAGVPHAVTERARALVMSSHAPAMVGERPATYMTVSGEPSATDLALARAAASIDIASTTPIEALNLLYALQQTAVQLLQLQGRVNEHV